MKDEQKKLIIVAVLACIVLGVGAFQFLGGGGKGAPGPVAPKPALVAAKDDKPALKNPEFAAKFAARDPFAVPSAVNPPDPAAAKPPVTNYPRPRPMGGQLGNGQLANGESLPSASGSVGPIGVSPVSPPAPLFGYRLSGVIVGHRPAAVFTDSVGGQRLVNLGSSLDGDSQLVGVRKGEVIVKFRGERLHLTLGGSPDASK